MDSFDHLRSWQCTAPLGWWPLFFAFFWHNLALLQITVQNVLSIQMLFCRVRFCHSGIAEQCCQQVGHLHSPSQVEGQIIGHTTHSQAINSFKSLPVSTNSTLFRMCPRSLQVVMITFQWFANEWSAEYSAIIVLQACYCWWTYALSTQLLKGR